VRLKEGARASERLVAFVEDRSESLKDVGDIWGDIEDDGDVVGYAACASAFVQSAR
jgi:hypothetical protein